MVAEGSGRSMRVWAPAPGRRMRPGWVAILGIIVGVVLGPLGLLAPAAPAARAFAASAATSVPSGFTKTLLASGLKKPTAIAFAPNGDIYIAEQIGTILIYRNGAILPTPVLTLNTDSAGEKGLLGLALDPNFATNGYLYVSYTT